MKILNENEAIVINSLKNWEKVAEILDKHNVRWRLDKASEWKPSKYAKFLIMIDYEGFLKYDFYDVSTRKTLIQDTEFIAKHSLKVIKENLETFYSQDCKTDKNMKIVVKKDIGLFIPKEVYEVKVTPNQYSYQSQINNVLSTYDVLPWQHDLWLKNGYIEEVKEVSYRFEDIEGTLVLSPFKNLEIKTLCATEKQAKQADAFAKLTHVRAMVLKKAGYSEDWEAKKNEECFSIFCSLNSGIIDADSFLYRILTGAYLLFPTPELAELALKDNQELFKTYLGV